MTENQKNNGTIIALTIMLLIILLGMLSGCKEDFITPAGCINESQIIPYKDRVCTMEVEYVCGCNGQTYINKCHAEADGLTNIWPTTLEDNCKN